MKVFRSIPSCGISLELLLITFTFMDVGVDVGVGVVVGIGVEVGQATEDPGVFDAPDAESG